MSSDPCSMTRESSGESVVSAEEQRFRQIWILILVGFIAMLAWYSFLLQIVIGEPFGTNPAPDILVLALLVLFGILFPVWFLVMRLEVQVTRTDLRFRLFPLHLQCGNSPLPPLSKQRLLPTGLSWSMGAGESESGGRGRPTIYRGTGECRSRWKAGGRSCSDRSSQRNWRWRSSPGLREGSGNREKYRGHEPSVFAAGWGPGLLGCASAL